MLYSLLLKTGMFKGQNSTAGKANNFCFGDSESNFRESKFFLNFLKFPVI